jgi:site-specific DNA-methyltransferase (cytosine-N4-specific)
MNREKLYQLKITLDGIEPKIWRRVLVSEDLSLAKLHFVIQSAMGWWISHLHQFICKGVHYTKNDLLKPMLENLAELTELTSAELNRKFEDVVAELEQPDKHVRGKALELFSVWIVRLLGLRFSKWRAKNFKETGGGEVDVIAASDRVVYSRWQIQCKNTKIKVDVDIVAKEVGLTFVTKADVVMFVTTGECTSNAVNYANQVTEVSRYYVILLDKHDIARILEDKARIIEILNVKARRVFAKRELGFEEFGEVDLEENRASEEIVEDVFDQTESDSVE